MPLNDDPEAMPDDEYWQGIEDATLPKPIPEALFELEDEDEVDDASR
jgi:hypothetical protein